MAPMASPAAQDCPKRALTPPQEAREHAIPRAREVHADLVRLEVRWHGIRVLAGHDDGGELHVADPDRELRRRTAARARRFGRDARQGRVGRALHHARRPCRR